MSEILEYRDNQILIEKTHYFRLIARLVSAQEAHDKVNHVVSGSCQTRRSLRVLSETSIERILNKWRVVLDMSARRILDAHIKARTL